MIVFQNILFTKEFPEGFELSDYLPKVNRDLGLVLDTIY